MTEPANAAACCNKCQVHSKGTRREARSGRQLQSTMHGKAANINPIQDEERQRSQPLRRLQCGLGNPAH